MSDSGDYVASSLPSGAYAVELPVGSYTIYQQCGDMLLPVAFPDFLVTIDPGENTGDIYLADCNPCDPGYTANGSSECTSPVYRCVHPGLDFTAPAGSGVDARGCVTRDFCDLVAADGLFSIDGATCRFLQDDLYVFEFNYNVLRIMSGMGGLAYSN